MTKDRIPQTPEAVAYKLMKDIFKAEKKNMASDNSTRNDILETYAQCIKVVKCL